MLHAMQINLISVGNKMPAWVQQGYQEYSSRLPKECVLQLKEVTPGKRTKSSDIQRILKDEGNKMLAAIPAKAHVVTLDIPGKPWDTGQLADHLRHWQENHRMVCLMIGGPEGLSDAVRQVAGQSWSLSRLTLPHPLVRVVVAEQIYRAWSILQNHPYHRE